MFIFGNITIFAEIIFFLLLRDLAVFDRLCGAIADASHTMRTCIAPLRLFILKRNVVQRAKLYAFAAADAVSLDVKCL